MLSAIQSLSVLSYTHLDAAVALIRFAHAGASSQKPVARSQDRMEDNRQIQRPASGPFGMGRQGYHIIAIVVGVTGLFAASRSDWTSMLVSALVLPLIMFPIIFALSRRLQDGAKVRGSGIGLMEDADPITFLARTNPIMFLLFGALSRRSDDNRYRQLLRAGPYGMGQQGYLIALILILSPLVLALMITALTGQQPSHNGPHFP
jgi:hypothetical protein